MGQSLWDAGEKEGRNELDMPEQSASIADLRARVEAIRQQQDKFDRVEERLMSHVASVRAELVTRIDQASRHAQRNMDQGDGDALREATRIENKVDRMDDRNTKKLDSIEESITQLSVKVAGFVGIVTVVVNLAVHFIEKAVK